MQIKFNLDLGVTVVKTCQDPQLIINVIIFSDPNSVLGHRFKVILLIRDPRATINSLLKAPHEWVNLAPNPKMACTNIYNDLTAFNRFNNKNKMNLKIGDGVLEK